MRYVVNTSSLGRSTLERLPRVQLKNALLHSTDPETSLAVASYQEKDDAEHI